MIDRVKPVDSRSSGNKEVSVVGLVDRRLGGYPYIKKRRNSGQILSFRTNPTKLYML